MVAAAKAAARRYSGHADGIERTECRRCRQNRYSTNGELCGDCQRAFWYGSETINGRKIKGRQYRARGLGATPENLASGTSLLAEASARLARLRVDFSAGVVERCRRRRGRLLLMSSVLSERDINVCRWRAVVRQRGLHWRCLRRAGCLPDLGLCVHRFRLGSITVVLCAMPGGFDAVAILTRRSASPRTLALGTAFAGAFVLFFSAGRIRGRSRISPPLAVRYPV